VIEIHETKCNSKGVLKRNIPREYELREPIPHIGLCTHHEPGSASIFKRNVIGQIVKTFKTQKLKIGESVGEEVHLTFVD